MKGPLRLILLTFIICSGTSYSQAQNNEKIEIYTVNDGLSQQSVTCITQDSKNFLWIGTFDGLNRFDGKKFETFRHINGDSTSIINNRIIALANDEDEGLWILFANNHIGKFTGNGKFTNYNLGGDISDLGNGIRNLQICDGYLIVTGEKSETIFFSIDTQSTDTDRIATLKNITHDIETKGERVISLGLDDNKIWISATDGIYCIIDKNVHKVSSLSGFCLNCTGNGHIALWKDGEAVIYETLYEKIERPQLFEIARFNVGSEINVIASPNNREFYIGSLSGVYKYVSNKLSFYPPASRIRTIFCDNMGIIWCGGGNGLRSVNPYSKAIHNFKFSREPFSFCNYINTLNISPDKTQLYVGSRHTGLNILSIRKLENGQLEIRNNERFLHGQNISMIYPFSNDSTLIGADKSLYMMTRNNGTISFATIKADRSWIHPFKAAKSGSSIYFSNGQTLNKLHRSRSGKFVIDSLQVLNSQLNLTSIITVIAKDPRTNVLWVGSRGDGLFRIDPEKNRITNLHEITDDRITNPYIWDLYFDASDRLWIGTDAGLNVLYQNDSTFHLHSISSRDGLINDKIDTIQEDMNGQIWMGTSHGIICYNHVNGIFKTYGYEDGFQSDNFTGTSCHYDDFLIFGGANGFSWFNPALFQNSTVPPSVNINNIIVGGTALSEDKWEDIRIRDYKDISIELCSYYSPNPLKVKYRYRINGSGWNETSDNILRFNNLRPGKYTVLCKAFINADVESRELTVRFKILRPLFASISAICIYSILACICIFMIIKTITTRKLLSDKLKAEETLRLNERELSKEKLNFYTNMAHEIKTPLTLILGRTNDIENSDEASPDIVRKVRLINDNALIINQLTDQILEFKRAVSGKLTLDINDTDIMPSINNIIDNYRDYANKRGITIELESSSDILTKPIDIQKFIRILYNLISNAIKFSERGGRILVKITEKNDELILVVSDTGCGISETDLPHIFERFYKSNKSGGFGIGLAFTKSLVELMGGDITVTSRLGEGSTFMVRIPDQSGAKKGNIRPDSHTPDKKTGNNIFPSILVVEDDIELNSYISEILTIKFKVYQTYNVKEAMHTLRNKDVDMILSDIMMPGTDGIEFARKIKGIKAFAHIPVIFLSAKSDQFDQLDGLAAGAVDYIVKPFNPNILLLKIQNILAQYYLSKEKFREADLPATEYTDKTYGVNRDEMLINRAREIIYKNLSNENFSVSRLSMELGISRVHLTREFQRIINTSPSIFIKKIRLNYARHMLQSGNVSIKEVLFEIGIRSHSGFTKAFKEEFGYLPSQMPADSEDRTANDNCDK